MHKMINPSGSLSVKAELYTPSKVSKPIGAVILAYGSDGLTDENSGPWKTMMEGFANGLSNEGLVAIIPHYFDATATEPPFPIEGFFKSDFPSKSVQWEEALLGAIAFAKARPDVDPTRIGLLGFSLGGHLCFQLRDKAKVMVLFFPPRIPLFESSGTVPFAQVHCGDEDTFFEGSQLVANTLKKEAEALGGEHEVEFHGYDDATHGFGEETDADRAALSVSKTRTLDFFKKHL